MSTMVTVRPTKWIAAAIVAIGCVVFTSCVSKPSVPPRNLIIITFDTCRADHVSAYGYPRNTTPNVEAFAARSVVFDHAYSTAASTAPALSSLMTSKYPHQHGVLETYSFALSLEENTLAERMAAAGHATGAELGIGVLMPSRRLDQGFEHYGFTRYTNRQYWRTGDEITERALAWLAANHDEPFFLWVHYFEPHQPYNVVPADYLSRFDGVPNPDPLLARVPVASPYRERVQRRLNDYDGALAFADSEFGRLISVIESYGLFDDSMIVFSADHGETLGEHGQHGHVFGLWQPVVHVPLIIYRPGVSPGRVDENVSLVDVVPTVIEQFDLPDDPSLQGRALPLARSGLLGSSVLATKPEIEQADVFAETWFKETRVAMINTGRWKYVVEQKQDGSSSAELYDLADDPEELRNRADEKSDLSAQLERDLRAWMIGDFTKPGLITQKPGELEMLKALGYLQ